MPLPGLWSRPLPTAGIFAVGSISATRGPGVPRLLPGDLVHVLPALHLLVGPLAARLQRLARWAGGDESVAAVANEVGAPGGAECLAHFEVVLRGEEDA